MKISSIIISKNEEARIEKCLSSLAWTDEVIVVDNGSEDKTQAIVRAHKATVVSAKGINDFAKLRNLGSEKANSGWLLYVDADEVVTEELAKEIREVTSPPAGRAGRHDSPTPSSSGLTRGSSLKQKLDSPAWAGGNDKMVNGYEIRRKNYYLGHMWPGDEYILRLMRKDALVEWYGKLHETARIRGEIGRLNAPMIHNTHRTLEEMLQKTNDWSEVEAALRLKANHPPVVSWRLWRVALTGFFKSYIHEGGYRAGTIGFIESMYQAFSMFITYAKLWELQQSKARGE